MSDVVKDAQALVAEMAAAIEVATWIIGPEPPPEAGAARTFNGRSGPWFFFVGYEAHQGFAGTASKLEEGILAKLPLPLAERAWTLADKAVPRPPK